MVYTRRSSLIIGSLMFFSFFGVLALIFSPVFSGKNGLDYADELFNKLAKGSAYFIPHLLGSAEKFVGTSFRVSLSLEKGGEAEKVAKLFASAGALTESQGAKLMVEGDLGKVLQSALRDSDQMFKNDGEKVRERYGEDERKTMLFWWTALTRVEKSLKKSMKIEESGMVSEVLKKGIEPAYNFYRIEPQRVADRAGIMIFLLIFYIGYTLWWGFAIFYLFEGFGLSMKKARVKKET
jgi:hypothetical protein